MPPYKEICSESRELIHTKNGFHEIPGYVRIGLSKQQRNFLNLASRIAETSSVDKRHGAVVVKAGRVLAVGVNKWRNQALVNPDSYAPHLTVHAEVDALSRLSDAKGATLYISRLDKFGREQYSKPCPRCEKAIIESGVKAVIYTT